jgi:MFS family permease
MPGISRLNAVSLFGSAFVFVVFATFVNFLQPYVLNDILHVPAEQQGSITGLLNFFQEGTALVLVGLVGAYSDRIGRRQLCAAGFLIWGVGLALFPTAEAAAELYVYRFVIAVGTAVATATVLTTMQDYPQEVSRAKWGATNSVLTSFAILLVSLGLARVPGMLEAQGYSAAQAGRITFGIVAAVAVAAALGVRVGWHRGHLAGESAPRSPFAGLFEGLAAARDNPRLALAFCAGFAARGDLVVIGAFFSLWFVRSGAGQGIASSTALARGGMTLFALQVATWIWAPLFGWLLDRMDRVRGLALAMALAAVGYGAIGAVSNPFDPWQAVPATFLLGVGEISAVIAGNALIGQEAPARIRGATVGLFSLFGTVGILSATLVGGIIFDRIAHTAPFTMMAAVNGLVCLLAVSVATAAARNRATA